MSKLNLNIRDILILEDAERGDLASMRYIVSKLLQDNSDEDLVCELHFRYGVSVDNIKLFLDAYNHPNATAELLFLTNKQSH